MTIRAGDTEPARTTAVTDLLNEVRHAVDRPRSVLWAVAVVAVLAGAAVGLLLDGPTSWPAIATLIGVALVLAVLPLGLALGLLVVQLVIEERERR